MSKRHSSKDDLQSKIVRIQEIILSHSGVDDFYEIFRFIILKHLCEKTGDIQLPSFKQANKMLAAYQDKVGVVLDEGILLQSGEEVYNLVSDEVATLNVTAQDLSALDSLFEFLTNKIYKSNKGQFFTPRHVVDMCVEILAPAPNETICDPACGSGAFLKSANTYQLKHHAKFGKMFAFDYSLRACQVARVMSLLTEECDITVHNVDSLNMHSSLFPQPNSTTIESLMGEDFKGFDIILTNPPFAGDVSSEVYSQSYDLAQQNNRKLERDVLFIERCINLLAPNGRMAIVLPDNKVSGKGFSGVRNWIMRRAKILGVVSLHRYTFLPHTSQKAAILFLQKIDKMAQIPDYQINLFRSDKPGKTSNGSMLFKGQEYADLPPYLALDHDLDEIVQQWKSV